MNLRKRINKLREDGRSVTVREYSLFTFDGSYAAEAARNFWIGMCIFLVLALFAFWIGHGVYTGNLKSMNPEVIRLEMEREKQREEEKRKDKQQYIDGCKAAGKSPSDLGESREYWECK